MARCARERKPGSVYLIQQTCAGGKYLIQSKADEAAFLAILKKLKKSFDFKLFAFRLQPGSFELLLCPQLADISSVMRSLTIQVAHYHATDGPLYKERYKSTCIQTKGAFMENYLMLSAAIKPQFRTLLDPPSRILELPQEVIDHQLGHQSFLSHFEPDWSSHKLCMDDTHCCVTCQEQGKKVLEQKLDTLNLTISDLKNHKVLRNELVLWFRQNSKLSLREIGHLLGGLSESAVSKIIKAHA